MKNREITIYDIAQELQISPATVSRALKDNASIGKETTRVVKELAEQWGYQPNALASNLRNSKTNTIGVIVPQINRPFIASAISGIEQVANEAGYQVLIAQTNDLYEKEVTHTRTMFANRVEGLIVSLAMETISYQHFTLFQKKNIPLVFFDRVHPELESAKIVIDDYKAAFEATEHLIQQGCRQIAHLAGSQNRENYRNRVKGYLAALHKYNLPVDKSLILYDYLSREAGWKAANILLSKTIRPDGIFSANDTAAVSVIQAIKEAGLKIPEDIAIVGFNDDPVATIIEPTLTTIAYPAYQMGQTATQQFLQLKSKENKNIPVQNIQLQTKLIIRNSSKRN